LVGGDHALFTALIPIPIEIIATGVTTRIILVGEPITIVVYPVEAVVNRARTTLINTRIDALGASRTVRIFTSAGLADFQIP
jgi:hypothetical protein